MDFRLPPQFIQRHTEARRRAVNPSVRSSAHLRPRQKTLILRTPFDRPVQSQQPLSGETGRSVCRRGVRSCAVGGRALCECNITRCLTNEMIGCWAAPDTRDRVLSPRALSGIENRPASITGDCRSDRPSSFVVVGLDERNNGRRRAAMTTPSHGCFIFSAPSVRGTWQRPQLQSVLGYGRIECVR
jgi:hypothetical protein